MNNSRANISLIISIISLISFGLLISGVFNKKKVAYVRSTELIYGYLGMQTAHKEYEEKSKSWQANVDTLQKEYQQALGNYTKMANKLGKEEKETQEHALQQQQQMVYNYMQSINAKAKQEDEKTTQAVLNQVNSFVEDYGKKNGYDIILGTTLSGSLLYGDDAMDITKEVLAKLNESYKGD